MKIFLDTNIWIRYFVADNKLQHEACLQLIQLIEKGVFKPYTSTLVLLEINFVLTKLYNLKEKEVMSDLDSIIQTRNLVLLEKTNWKVAYMYYKKYGIKLADCLIASQISKDTVLCTFDKGLAKIREVLVQSPEQIINKLPRK